MKKHKFLIYLNRREYIWNDKIIVNIWNNDKVYIDEKQKYLDILIHSGIIYEIIEK